MKGAGINVLVRPESLRGADDKRLRIVDNPADVVGDPSSGVGGVRAPLEGQYLQLRPPSPGLRGGAHPRRVAADDH